MDVSFECELKWDDLDGASHVKRHCEVCDHEVYNLTAMTREQAQRLVELHRGRKLCARYVQRNGRIVHNAEPQLRQQRSGARKLVAAALLAQAAFLAFADDPAGFFFDPLSVVGVSADRADDYQETFEPADQEVMGAMVTF